MDLKRLPRRWQGGGEAIGCGGPRRPWRWRDRDQARRQEVRVRGADVAVLMSYFDPQYHWVALEPGTICGTPVESAIHQRTWERIGAGSAPTAACTLGHSERIV